MTKEKNFLLMQKANKYHKLCQSSILHVLQLMRLVEDRWCKK